MFEGFTTQTSDFLWELAFHNERPWFLAHKEQFEQLLNRPLKALAADTAALMEQRFPSRGFKLHVSRIYRDARRLFGRGPYKDHLWFSLKSNEILLEGPMFWFENGAIRALDTFRLHLKNPTHSNSSFRLYYKCRLHGITCQKAKLG